MTAKVSNVVSITQKEMLIENPLSKMPLSIESVAAATGYSYDFIVSACHSGEIPCEQEGKGKKITLHGSNYEKIVKGLAARADRLAEKKGTVPRKITTEIAELRERLTQLEINSEESHNALSSRVNRLLAEIVNLQAALKGDAQGLQKPHSGAESPTPALPPAPS